MQEGCRDEGKSVLFSTHHMHEVDRLCDRVVIIAEGRKRFQGDVPAMREAGGHQQLDRAFLGIVSSDGKEAA